MTTPPPATPTMDDVATLADVSRATVSRVLSGSARVAESTRERVYRAISELGYVPNLAAQQLAGSTNTTLGLLLRDPRVPAYGLLHTELAREAATHGAGILAAVPAPEHGADIEQSNLQRLLGARVGGLFVATGVINSSHVRPFLSAVPVVSVGRLESDPRIPAVSYDEAAHGRMLADWVIQYGHGAVGVLSVGPEVSLGESARAAAITARLRERGADVLEVPATTFGVVDENVETLVRLVTEGRITCAVFPTDRRALGFLTVARKAGLRVPEDVSVVGCDGVGEHIRLLGLASLRLPLETVARRAVEVMMTLTARTALSAQTAPTTPTTPSAPTALSARGATRGAYQEGDSETARATHELHRGLLVEGNSLSVPSGTAR